jgi:hypothetical protein
MIKKAGWVVLAAGIVIAGSGWAPTGLSASPPVTVSAVVNAVPASFSGYCPKTIVFQGKITVSGACSVQYKFIRSDSAVKPIKTLVFPAAGVMPVEDTWTLGDTYSGWEAIQIVSPVAYTSPHASFTLTCLPKPNIVGAFNKHFGSPVPELDITGTNFGATQGTKNVQIDGHLITAMPGWSMEWWHDYQISLMTGGLIPWEHVYQIAIVDGGAVISNVYSVRFLYKGDGTNPASGLPGSTFTAYFWEVPPAPGGLVLKMGSAACTIVQWAANAIKAKVPGLPAGTYDVYLQKGGDNVSFKNSFKVLPFIVIPKK